MTALLQNLIGNGNRRGITSMVMAMLLFSGHDAFMKLAGLYTGFAQAVFIRGLVGTLLASLLVIGQGQMHNIRAVLHPKALQRACTDLGATGCYVLALFHMPLGNITAIIMAAPLTLTAIAALLLHEQVGWRRWSAVICGFTGVLLIVQPVGDGFNAWSLLALGAMLSVVLRDLVTRKIGMSIPMPIMIMTSSLVTTLASGCLLLFQGWQPLESTGFLMLAGSAICLISGFVFSIDFMRHGALAVVAPFRYAGLLFGLGLGYLIWNEIPNLLAASGIALVLASGLYLLHRERLRRLAENPRVE